MATYSSAAPPAIEWDYTPPWQPINKPCPSCNEKIRLGRRIRGNDPFADLQPGELRKLDPEGKTTIVKMAVERVKTPNSTVQLVYIPQGRLSSLADKGLAKMVTSESRNVFSRVSQPSIVSLPEFSDKQKRDQRGQRIQGGIKPDSFPMTLVAAEGAEKTAKEQLKLLEAALSSPQATESKDGQLPRVFIAPSNIPPPPGYVKIPLVPQKQAEKMKKKLPSTFLTHSNPKPLPPGFVRLSLPASVSQLSQDIPLVNSNKVPNEIQSNVITESSFITNERSERNSGKAFPSKVPSSPNFTFGPRENLPQPIRSQFPGDKRGGQAPLNQFSIKPQQVTNNVIQSGKQQQPILHGINAHRFVPNQGSRIIILRNNQNVGLQQIHNNGQSNRKPTIVNIPVQSTFRPQNQQGPSVIRQQTQEQERSGPENQRINTRPVQEKQRVDLSSGFQTFKPLSNIAPNQLPPPPPPKNFRPVQPSRPSSNHFGPPIQSRPQNALESRIPQTFSNEKRVASKEESFQSQQQIRRPHDSSAGSQLLPHGGLNTNQNPSAHSRENFNSFQRPLHQNGNGLIQSSVKNIQSGATTFGPPNQIQVSTSRPFSNERLPKEIPSRPGIQVISKGEPKPQISAHDNIQPHSSFENRFPSSVPQRTTQKPFFSSERNLAFDHNRPIIGTPATVSFKQKQASQSDGLPLPHDPRFMDMIKKQNEQQNKNLDVINSQENIVQTPRPSTSFSTTPKFNQEPISPSQRPPSFSHKIPSGNFNNFVRFPPRSQSTTVNLQSNIQIQNHRPSFSVVDPNEVNNVSPSLENNGHSRANSNENIINRLSGEPSPSIPINPNSFPPSFVSHGVSTLSPVRVNPNVGSSPSSTERPQISTFQSSTQQARVTAFPSITQRSQLTSFPSSTQRPRVTSFTPPVQFSASPIPGFVTDRQSSHNVHSSSAGRVHVTTPTPFVSSTTFKPETTQTEFVETTPDPFISSTERPLVANSPTPSPKRVQTFNTRQPFAGTNSFSFNNVAFREAFDNPDFFKTLDVPRPLRPRPSVTPKPVAVSSQQPFEHSSPEPRQSFVPGTTPETFNAFQSGSQETAPFSNTNLFSRGKTVVSSQERFPSSHEPFTTESPFVEDDSLPEFQNFETEGRFPLAPPESSFPTPQRINLQENNFLQDAAAINPISPIPVSSTQKPRIRVTTFKPKFNFNFGRPVISTTSLESSTTSSSTTTSSSVPNQSAEIAGETTLFPPFSVARRRQRLNKKDEKSDVSVDDSGKKIQPAVFGRRIRPRFRQRNRGDQAASGSESKRISASRSTTTQTPSIARLNVSNRVRNRARARTTTSTVAPTTTEEVEEEILSGSPGSNQNADEEILDSGIVTKSVRQGPNILNGRKRVRTGERRRPGARRVPQWLRDRRRRLRARTTTENPADSISSDINDPPIEFIDDNAFRAAESARVVFTQPPENTQRISAKRTSATEYSTVLKQEESETVTGAPEPNAYESLESIKLKSSEQSENEQSTDKYDQIDLATEQAEETLEVVPEIQDSTEAPLETNINAEESVARDNSQYVRYPKHSVWNRPLHDKLTDQQPPTRRGFQTYFSSDSSLTDTRPTQSTDAIRLSSDIFEHDTDVESPVFDSEKIDSESLNSPPRSMLPEVPRFKSNSQTVQSYP